MARKTKGRAGGHQATLKICSRCNSTGTASRVKADIVTLPVLGLASNRVASPGQPLGRGAR